MKTTSSPSSSRRESWAAGGLVERQGLGAARRGGAARLRATQREAPGAGPRQLQGVRCSTCSQPTLRLCLPQVRHIPGHQEGARRVSGRACPPHAFIPHNELGLHGQPQAPAASAPAHPCCSGARVLRGTRPLPPSGPTPQSRLPEKTMSACFAKQIVADMLEVLGTLYHAGPSFLRTRSVLGPGQERPPERGTCCLKGPHAAGEVPF